MIWFDLKEVWEARDLIWFDLNVFSKGRDLIWFDFFKSNQITKIVYLIIPDFYWFFLRNEEPVLNGVRFHVFFSPKSNIRVHYEWLYFYYDLIWFECVFQTAWFDLKWFWDERNLIWIFFRILWFDLIWNDLIWNVPIPDPAPAYYRWKFLGNCK